MSEVYKIENISYPELMIKPPGWFDRTFNNCLAWVACRSHTRVHGYGAIVEKVARYDEEFKKLSDTALRQQADQLRAPLRKNNFPLNLVAKSFSLTRQAAIRSVGMRHFDVQLIGGWVLLKGMIAEMETGEGKTLAATLAATTAALAGIRVCVITVNDYLAKRDADAMSPIYSLLGLNTNLVVHDTDETQRRNAYRSNIVYCSNKEIVFDYLRDRIVLQGATNKANLCIEKIYRRGARIEKLLLNGLEFAIVDEADSVLIDEAVTPLIISKDIDDDGERELYRQAMEVSRRLVEETDYRVYRKDRRVELTDIGRKNAAELTKDMGGYWAGPRRVEDLLKRALAAICFYKRDQSYVVLQDKVQIVDEYTGRLMPDRSWENGMHQLIEAKENCPISGRKETVSRISYQSFFRRFIKLSGMTGTAREVRKELWSVYRLRVVSIPTDRPMHRKGLPDDICVVADQKWAAIIARIKDEVSRNRPVLIGTRSVQASQHLSVLLSEIGIKHRVLNAKEDKREAEIIKCAGEYGRVTIATNMAGRGTDIKLQRGVADIGGLYVLATERHEAKRIDRQLFGRCGRQGDPGSYRASVCLDDELIIKYINPILRRLVGAALAKGFPGSRSVSRLMFWYAQAIAQRRYAQFRKQLQDYDEKMQSALSFSGRPD